MQKNSINSDEAKRLFLHGYSLTVIAARLGCTRQGVRQRLIADGLLVKEPDGWRRVMPHRSAALTSGSNQSAS